MQQFEDKLSLRAKSPPLLTSIKKNAADEAAADLDERARLLRVLQDLSTTIGTHGQQ